MKFSEEYIEETLKDTSKITNFILEGNDVSLLYKEDHTDALLESLIKKNINVLKRILEAGFPNKEKKYFLYIHHAIRTKKIRFVKELVEHYKKYGISINEIDSSNLNCFDVVREMGEFKDKNEIVELLKKEIE